eukprot:1120977-Pelagomonas_calceolata.AAC.1
MKALRVHIRLGEHAAMRTLQMKAYQGDNAAMQADQGSTQQCVHISLRDSTWATHDTGIQAKTHGQAHLGKDIHPAHNRMEICTAYDRTDIHPAHNRADIHPAHIRADIHPA